MGLVTVGGMLVLGGMQGDLIKTLPGIGGARSEPPDGKRAPAGTPPPASLRE